MVFNKITHNNISNSGYTLIELLTVITIMGIMSAVAVLSYSGNKKNAILDKSVRQLVLDLRRAQNMAMNTAVFDHDNDISTPSVIPKGGYGIYINTPRVTSYIIYGDSYTPDTTPPIVVDKIYTSGSDGIVVSRTFDPQISISAVTNSVTSLNVTSVDFLPPNPNIYFDGVLATGNTTIRLEYGAAEIVKDIVINGLTGQISVN